ncbi:MAG: outer membrane beta-barrel protein [Saprospiraceae bacterium]|nr:outer membrane beta-barrel protein [Saprospiraceae bacterium]
MRTKSYLLLFFLLPSIAVWGQLHDYRMGVQMSPTFSWFSSNERLVSPNGANLGIQFGLQSELYFSDQIGMTVGAAISFNQGGRLYHEIGGNLLPNSELTDKSFNTGTKPLPDGTNIRYHLQVIHLPVGMKFRTTEFGYIRYFLEAPIIDPMIISKSRGTITGFNVDLDGENIRKDVSKVQPSIGIGLGMEYNISMHNAVIFGLYFHKSLLDLTKNGTKAILTDDKGTPTPADDMYRRETENAKIRMNRLQFRVGILF